MTGLALLQLLSSAAIVGDGVTTVRALRRPGTVERNPLLGPRPSVLRVCVATAAALALNSLVPLWLPPWARGVGWVGVTVVEGHFTLHNLRAAT